MKSAIHLLLMGVLATGPLGCNRSDVPDESVSANAGSTDRSAQTAPGETINPPAAEPQRQTTRETRQSYRPPDKPANKPAQAVDNRREERTETRTQDRSDPLRADRETRSAEPQTRRAETVPSGTAFTVTLADTISTSTNQAGDSFTAHLSQPIVVNGRVVADKGDRVTGHIARVDEPGRVKGRARLELVLDEIRTSQDSYRLSTEPFIVVAEDTKERDAAGIAGGAGVGAAIGAITGGKKGAAIGAIIGGGTGTTAVLLTKGKQLKLEPETKVNFVLARDVALPVIRNSST